MNKFHYDHIQTVAESCGILSIIDCLSYCLLANYMNEYFTGKKLILAQEKNLLSDFVLENSKYQEVKKLSDDDITDFSYYVSYRYDLSQIVKQLAYMDCCEPFQTELVNLSNEIELLENRATKGEIYG